MLTSLYSFTGGNDGANPQAGLVQGSDGYFYGTTSSGGTDSYGTVFRISTTGVLTTLYSFMGDDGRSPGAGLVQGSDGNFYGTTENGGTSGGYGTVFKISTNGALTSLYSFTGGNDGGGGNGLVQGSDGYFYGTTYYGGTKTTYYGGTVFKISTNGALTTLYSFSDGNDGGQPLAGLVQGSDGNFYGTTLYGGTNGDGTVFKISTNGVLTSLYSFTGGNDGGNPYAGLVQGSDGNFYGTTENGGTNNWGTVFKIGTNGALTSLHSFTGGDDGGNPEAGLVQGSDGNFYGTTYANATTGAGTVFKISTNGVLTSLYSFASGNDGAGPDGLVQGSDGYFYGTTYQGGTYGSGYNGSGTVFKISTTGALTSLYSFTGGDDGGNPYAGLVQGSDGYFYGTTYQGGTNNWGTVFKISTNGALTNLYSFTGGNDGANPEAGLVQGSDGNFYGTTDAGGTHGSGYDGYGTVFKISTNGALTSMYSFTGGDDGGSPNGLVQGSDGYFYGTTYSGGTSNSGTVFKISTNGVLTNLYSFTGGNDGANPEAGLVQSSDGDFYGTTYSGGTSNSGTVFRISTNGALTSLYSFTGGDDGGGANGLVQSSDGNFYGTTAYGGTYGLVSGGYGTVFKISTNGALTSLYSFTGGNDGARPYAALARASDGSFYGAASSGGAGGAGTVFRLTLERPELTIIPYGAYVFLTWPTNATGFTLESATNLASPVVWSAVSPGPVVIGDESVVFNPATGPQKFYRLKLSQ